MRREHELRLLAARIVTRYMLHARPHYAIMRSGYMGSWYIINWLQMLVHVFGTIIVVRTRRIKHTRHNFELKYEYIITRTAPITR